MDFKPWNGKDKANKDTTYDIYLGFLQSDN